MKELAKKANKPFSIYLHAEVLAIIRVKTGVPYKIKVERYNSKGEPKLAAPCPLCMILIKKAKIKIIEYTIG